MKKTRFTESQIITALKLNEAGRDVNEICRELVIHRATFYNWKKKYENDNKKCTLTKPKSKRAESAIFENTAIKNTP